MAGAAFKNIIIQGPVSPELLAELAAGHRGTVKVVVDIRQMRMAAGGEWHSDCLALLTATGSASGDCWGAKLNTVTGAVTYKSQINQNRPNNRLDEIADAATRRQVLAMIEKNLTPSAEGE